MASIFSDISHRFRNSNAFEKIIILNILVYLLYTILKLFSVTYINEFFALTHDYLYNPWSILTYAFIHEGFYELIFMMILIYYSSSSLINLYGQKINLKKLRNLISKKIFIIEDSAQSHFAYSCFGCKITKTRNCCKNFFR